MNANNNASNNVPTLEGLQEVNDSLKNELEKEVIIETSEKLADLKGEISQNSPETTLPPASLIESPFPTMVPSEIQPTPPPLSPEATLPPAPPAKPTHGGSTSTGSGEIVR
jgi:hypothetical protein